MFETIVVVLVFLVLIGLGVIYYANVIKGNIESEKDESSQDKSIAIAQRVMFLSEIRCNEEGRNCIDTLKFDSAKTVMSSNAIHYYDLFEFSEISIIQIYPASGSWQLYSRRTKDFKSNFTTNVPVTTYDPIAKLYGFGILTIETLTK